MRKRYRVLIFAALVAALVVPVGYALSIDAKSKAGTYSRYAVAPAAATIVATPVMMHRTGAAMPNSGWTPMADSAKLVFVGTILFGLAAAVRKTV